MINKGIRELGKRERRIYLLLGSLLFGAIAAGFTYIKPVNDIDYLVSDRIYQSLMKKNLESSDIKLIIIDEKTTEKYGEYATWSRTRLATLLNALNSADGAPNVIGINLDLKSEKDSQGDAALLDVCRKYSNICLSGTVRTEEEKEAVPEKIPSPNDISQFPDTPPSPDKEESASIPPGYAGEKKIVEISLPYPALLQEVPAGIVNLNKTGPNGNVRSFYADIQYNGSQYDNYSIAVYKLHLAREGNKFTKPLVDQSNAFGINFSTEPGGYESYSFADVLDGKINTSLFQGSIVLIADGNSQEKYQIPGINRMQIQETQLQAQTINALLQNNTLRYAAKWFLAIWYAVFSAAFFIVTSYNSKIRSLTDSALLILLDIILCVLLNYSGFYIPLLQLILIIVMIAVSNLFLNYLISKRQRKELERVFKKYVDGQIVDEIVNNGPEAASIGVVRKDISVLFIDIRGFTSLSESLPPEQIADILNNYLTVIANAVAKNGGTLDKFIGDAAMAVFNSPFDQEDYVYKSVCTAWDILSNAAWLTQLCRNKYGKDIAFGIGIHCGGAVVGNIGSPSRMDFTAIGDTVNTAARLESSAAKGQILISREIKKRLGDRIEAKYSGKYALKGKKLPVDAYELTDIRDYIHIPEEPDHPESKWTAPALEELEILGNIAERSAEQLERLKKQINRGEPL